MTIATVVASALAVGGSHDAAITDLMVLYIGSQDCAPCRVWQDGEGTRFRSSPEFGRLRYREVKSANLLELLDDKNWPDELRPYRDQLGRGAAVPMWLVVADGVVVNREYGASQWPARVLPELRHLIRRTNDKS